MKGGNEKDKGTNLESSLIIRILTPLLPRHPLLLQLPRLRTRQLLLLLAVNLVTHRIVRVFLLSGALVDTWARTLAFNPVVAGRFEGTVAHRPDFFAQRLGEVAVVGDDEDTSLEDLERLNEGSERLAIEVVSRLIKAHNMRTTPCRSTKHNLNFLSTGETTHGVV